MGVGVRLLPWGVRMMQQNAPRTTLLRLACTHILPCLGAAHSSKVKKTMHQLTTLATRPVSAGWAWGSI